MTAARVHARDILTPDQIEQVRARHDWRGVWLVVHAWGVIFLAMVLFAAWPNPLTFLVSAFLIGGRQLGLSILMHDGAHGLLVKDAGWNMRLSQWFCGWPMFTDTAAYRTYHLKHHARTQQDDDPDLPLSAPFPISSASLRRKLFRDLSGQTGFNQRLSQLQAALGPSDLAAGQRLRRFWDRLGGALIVNGLLLAGLSLAGYWWLYPLLWLLPLLSVYQAVLRIRNIAEHACVGAPDDPFANARTTLANPIERLFLAPYWVNYHVEHHLLMWVPCYNLPKFHTFLREGPHGERMEIRYGYGDVLRYVASSSSDDGQGRKVHTRERRYSGLVMEQD